MLLGGCWASEEMVALASLACLKVWEEGAAGMQAAADLAPITAAEPRACGLTGTGSFGAC